MTATPAAPPAPATAPPDGRFSFALAVVALATGGFAIGTTEFVTMGLLPQIASGLSISIPEAGHLISAYALGVVVGAPTLAVIGAKLPRRGLLMGLIGAFAFFNLLTALVDDYAVVALVRFLDGVPHGAFFGLAVLTASDMVAPHRRGRAIALVMMGIPVANVAGVPLATLLGQQLGWRAAYVAVGLIALLSLVLIRFFVPATAGNSEATGRRELAALARPQVWYAVIASGIGFGGMFALISYIAPMTTEVGGLRESAVAGFLLVLGISMVVGNAVAGRLVDWSVQRTLVLGSVGLTGSLLLHALLAPTGWFALVSTFGAAVFGSMLALGFQVRLIDAAEDARTLGAALSHASLNIGNSLGAWLGGLTIAAGYGFLSPLYVGAALSVVGLAVIAVAHRASLDRPVRSEASTS